MVTERFAVIALPVSCADTAAAHVSLFVSPRLTADQPVGKLRDFEHFPRWARVLATAEFALHDQDGPIEATPVLDPLSDDAWRKVFPPATPVAAHAVPDLRGRRWRSFPAADVAGIGKLVHLATAVTAPTEPPGPRDSILAPLATRLLREFSGDRGYDESLITERFDRLVEQGTGRELLRVGPASGRTATWLDAALFQLHRARRFYERPEAQRPYRDRPDPKAKPPKALPRPEVDFHERCAVAGDHPALLRMLGLVVDLRVTEPERLRSSRWLSGRIVPQGDTGAAMVARTRCAVAGDDLVTVPGEDQWRDGRLRLGDEERYAVVDVDADGTALKTERFLVSFPRLLVAEGRGEPVNAATPALRATGLTVVQKERRASSLDRQDRQQALLAELDTSDGPELLTEDVTRGMQVEVWDAHARAWHSLHARIVDVRAGRNLEPVLEDHHEHGFIQGAAVNETPGVDDAPVHLHEALFGWDGWSLSAPRPGKRIRHEPGAPNGGEVVEDTTTPKTPAFPLVVETRVEPGTLPRLRFGRSYAFRAWAVDLAGNVRPHSLGPAGGDPDGALHDAVAAALAVRTQPAGGLLADASAALRADLTVLASAPTPEATEEGPAPALLRDATPLALAARGRLARRAASTPGGVTRAGLVAATVRRALADETWSLLPDPADRSTESLADVVAGAAPELDVAAALDVVSPVVPFLRWDPVEPPAIVARARFTPGESLRRLVVRSTVRQDRETLEVTVDASATTSERHLAPPKTSQVQAELHGRFDEAIGSDDPDDHRRLLAWAVREKGSFFDVEVPDLQDVTVRHPQPGIALEREDDPPRTESATLPLDVGDLPNPGQYVVHDTAELVLPYLPDPLARGVSFVFQDAGRDRAVRHPFGVEGFTARYRGDWPAAVPYRLVLRGGADLRGAVLDDVIDVDLPPGDLQRFRLSSCMDGADLDLFGVWRALPPAVTTDDAVVESAADGWWWSLTPFEDVTLVHAVTRPVEAPRTVLLRPARRAGSSDCPLEGAVDVHAPSTESLTLEASWTDPIDDPASPVTAEVAQHGVAFTVSVSVDEDLVVLGPDDLTADVPGVGPITVHGAVHRIGDTRHHVIDYRFRATTRFREYFAPGDLAPTTDPDPAIEATLPADDGRSVVGAGRRISVPSSAPPAAPTVHSVLPLFRWEDATEPEQPVGDRRRRRSGLRIYLERPWWSSGDGELLGVLVAPARRGRSRRTPDDVLARYVSQWGQDPVWRSRELTQRSMLFELEDLLRMQGFDDRTRDAAPTTTLTDVTLATVPEAPTVGVLGYAPAFSEARQLWYVDVAIDPADTFWPFVQLVVARYQPESVDGCHLSAPVRCPYVALPPERTTTVTRPDTRTARVVVSGPVGTRHPARRLSPESDGMPGNLAALIAQNRTVVASLQRRDPAVPTDLGWETVATAPLVVRGTGATSHEAAWVGELRVPDGTDDIPLVRPGENPDWRVAVEEWERLPGDPLPDADDDGPVWEQRLVFADELAL